MKILFACYHRDETHTLLHPLAERLHEQGHDSGILRALDCVDFTDSVVRRTFRYSTTPNVMMPTTYSEIESMLLSGGKVDKHVATRVSRLLYKQSPKLFGGFTMSKVAIAAMINTTWDKLVQEWRPDVVALSPGQIESCVIRRLCIRDGIPFVQLLTPFSELKPAERMRLPVDCRNDAFIVSSEIGRQMLVTQQGVWPDRIIVTGALSRMAPTTDLPPFQHLEILYNTQELPENLRLDKLLIRYVEEHPDVRMVMRPHPVENVPTIRIWKTLLAATPAADRISISPLGTPLRDDMSRAAVVVGIFSVSLYDAAMAGIPTISWCPALLPNDLRTGWTIIEPTKTYAELVAALDAVDYRKQQRVTASDAGKTESVTKVVERILSQIPTAG